MTAEALRNALQSFDPHASVQDYSDSPGSRYFVHIELDEQGAMRLLEQLQRPLPDFSSPSVVQAWIHEAAGKAANRNAYLELMLAAWMARWQTPPEDAELRIAEDPFRPGAFKITVESKPGTGSLREPQEKPEDGKPSPLDSPEAAKTGE